MLRQFKRFELFYQLKKIIADIGFQFKNNFVK